MALKSQIAGVTAVTPAARLCRRSLARSTCGSSREFLPPNNSVASKRRDHIRLVFKKCRPLSVLNETSTQVPPTKLQV